MIYILLIIVLLYLTILLTKLLTIIINPSANSRVLFNSSDSINTTEEAQQFMSEFLHKCEALQKDLILNKFVSSDYFYIESAHQASLMQLKKIIDEHKLDFINRLTVSTDYYQQFLIALLKIHPCGDSVFFRWANSTVGQEIINIIFEKELLLCQLVRTTHFWFELTRVLTSKDRRFSVLHGLSTEPGLTIFKKINSVINPHGITPGLKMRILKVALISVDNSTSLPENSVKTEFNKRKSKSEIQIVKEFKNNFIPKNSWYLFDDKRALTAVPSAYQTIELPTKAGVQVHNEIHGSRDDSVVKPDKKNLASIVASKSLATKPSLPTMIKPVMQVGESIRLKSLFEKSSDKHRCNILSAELISNKMGNLFDIPGFFDVFLKLELSVTSMGAISRGESILYYWIKWDCMLPLLKKMIEKQSDQSRLISHGSFNKALMCLSKDNLSPLHLLFQKKQLKFLMLLFKEQIKSCFKNDPVAFILLCLHPTIDQKNNKSCLLADMAHFDVDLFKELFSDETTDELITAMQHPLFVTGTPYLVNKLDQLYMLYPCHFISTLIEKNRNNLLRKLTQDKDGFFELVCDPKNNRKLLAEAFQTTAFRAAWNQLDLKDEALEYILTITKEQIHARIKSHEVYLSDLLDAILSHPQVSIKIQEQKSRWYDEPIIVPPQLKKLLVEAPVPTQMLTALQEQSNEVFLSQPIESIVESTIFQEVNDYLDAAHKLPVVAKKIIHSLCHLLRVVDTRVSKETIVDSILQLLNTMPISDIIHLSQSSDKTTNEFFEQYMWDKVEKQARMIRPINGSYEACHFLPPELFDFICFFETLLQLNQDIERKQLALTGSQIWKPFFDVTRDLDMECFIEIKRSSKVNHIMSKLIHYIKIQPHITVHSNQIIGQIDPKNMATHSVLLNFTLPGFNSPQGYYSVDLKINMHVDPIQKQMQKSLLGRRLTTDALLLINDNHFSLFTCPSRFMEFWSCAPNADDFSYAFYVISDGVHHTYSKYFTSQLAEFFELAHGSDNVLKRTLLIPAIQQFIKKLANKNYPIDIIFNKLEIIKNYFLIRGERPPVEIEPTIKLQRHERWLALIRELSESQIIRECFRSSLNTTFFSGSASKLDQSNTNPNSLIASPQ